ncbi:hypothetical protein [Nostoc sp. MS1]|uniref:hypothetical protein n=1 Tax=Nostoc sp. MS1 TaxID=2764711 RepID=UPI001CC3EC57|nr:hypothetical protein [Nostoc sp. MS1]
MSDINLLVAIAFGIISCPRYATGQRSLLNHRWGQIAIAVVIHRLPITQKCDTHSTNCANAARIGCQNLIKNPSTVNTNPAMGCQNRHSCLILHSKDFLLRFGRRVNVFREVISNS